MFKFLKRKSFFVRHIFLVTFFLDFFSLSGRAVCPFDYESIRYDYTKQDTLQGNQILYNGRMWRNLYHRIKEDQFLFSTEFLPGSVTIGGKTFKDLILRYDIYNDEIMTPSLQGTILQLNKEMVDSFTIVFLNKTYHFINVQIDSLRGFNGYVNILYKGKTALYVKYKKEIELLAVERKYDMFYQKHRIYLVKDGIVNLVTGRKDFFNLLGEYKLQIRSFIRKNKLKVTKKEPETLIPVVKFYNGLDH